MDIIGLIVIRGYFMYAKRIRCKKCGRTLVTGCAKNVEEITCSCGYVTYPHSEEMKKELSKNERRHNKYEKA